MALNDFQLGNIFDDAAKAAENATKPSLEKVLDLVKGKFTEEAGFTIKRNFTGTILNEIVITAHNASTSGTAHITSNGTLSGVKDGTFNVKFHLGDHDNSTSLDNTLRQLGTFYGHFKNPIPAVTILPPQGPFCGH
jgi:hypothetical protein